MTKSSELHGGERGASVLLRSLREACGLTQDRWAAFVGVSRKTVQRWESGDAVPDAAAEEAILALCDERKVTAGNRHGRDGRMASDEVAEALARARAARGRAAPGEPPVPDGDAAVDGPGRRLFGRRRLLGELHRAVTVSRLVTLTGPGGVGKTSVVRAFVAATSSLFVDLAALRDHELVGPTIAAVLGVHQIRGASLRDSVVTAIGDRPLLLALDNFEQVADAASLVGDLVVSCPRLGVVVTSRRPLRVVGEHVMAVPPLSIQDAVELFVARAGLEADAVAGMSADIAAICDRLDGLPLAVELVAARARSVPPVAMRARLDRAIDLAVAGPASLDGRHRALHTTLQWSHDLLDDRSKAHLHSISLFAGEFDLDAADAVVGPRADGEPIRDLLDRLQRDSLLELDDGPVVRARMLATIRDFADERAEADSEARAAAVGRYVQWYAGWAERAAARLRGAGQAEALAEMTGNVDNLRAGLRRAIAGDDPTAAARLATALAPWWDLRGAFTEGRAWIDQVLAMPAPALRGATLANWGAYLAWLEGDFDRSVVLADQALAVCQAAGVGQGEGYALWVLGVVAAERAEHDRAQELLERSAALLAETGDDWGRIRPLNTLGELARARGDPATALEFHDRALTLARSVGDTFVETYVLCGQAVILVEVDRPGEALALAGRALELASASRNRHHVATAVEAAALAEARLHLPDVAVRLWAAGQERREAIGAPIGPRDRPAHDRALNAARTNLGSDRFLAEWNTGRALTDADLLRLVVPDRTPEAATP